MNKYEIIIEDPLNAYILDKEENIIVALCTTKRPDLGFNKLTELVKQANDKNAKKLRRNKMIFEDFGALDNCQNIENSMGEICVKCNRCGRFKKVPKECYEKFGQDLGGCSTQQNEGCGRCSLFK